jgi:hypothetical protein
MLALNPNMNLLVSNRKRPPPSCAEGLGSLYLAAESSVSSREATCRTKVPVPAEPEPAEPAARYGEVRIGVGPSAGSRREGTAEPAAAESTARVAHWADPGRAAANLSATAWPDPEGYGASWTSPNSNGLARFAT